MSEHDFVLRLETELENLADSQTKQLADLQSHLLSIVEGQSEQIELSPVASQQRSLEEVQDMASQVPGRTGKHCTTAPQRDPLAEDQVHFNEAAE